MDNTLVPCMHWSHENFSVGMERLVELWPHFLEEYLGMYSLSLIQPYIGELRILIEGPSNIQVCIGKNDFPIWWYGVFICPNISYDADFFLLLMFGEMQHEQWDPNTLFLNKFFWMVFRSMGVPCKQWDLGLFVLGEVVCMLA